MEEPREGENTMFTSDVKGCMFSNYSINCYVFVSIQKLGQNNMLYFILLDRFPIYIDHSKGDFKSGNLVRLFSLEVLDVLMLTTSSMG